MSAHGVDSTRRPNDAINSRGDRAVAGEEVRIHPPGDSADDGEPRGQAELGGKLHGESEGFALVKVLFLDKEVENKGGDSAMLLMHANDFLTACSESDARLLQRFCGRPPLSKITKGTHRLK